MVMSEMYFCLPDSLKLTRRAHLLMLGHDITKRSRLKKNTGVFLRMPRQAIFGQRLKEDSSWPISPRHEYSVRFPEYFISGITDIPSQLYVDPDDRARIIGMMDQQGLARSNEIRFYRKHGKYYPGVSMTIMQTCDENGQALYFEGHC